MGFKNSTSKSNLDVNLKLESKKDKNFLIEEFLKKIEIKPLTLQQLDNARMKAYSPIC